jgi:hypothetical protein
MNSKHTPAKPSIMTRTERERRREVFEGADSVTVTKIRQQDYWDANPDEKHTGTYFNPYRLSASIDGVYTEACVLTWRKGAKSYLCPRFVHKDEAQPKKKESVFWPLNPSLRLTRRVEQYEDQGDEDSEDLSDDATISVEEDRSEEEQGEQPTASWGESRP